MHQNLDTLVPSGPAQSPLPRRDRYPRGRIPGPFVQPQPTLTSIDGEAVAIIPLIGPRGTGQSFMIDAADLPRVTEWGLR